MFPQIERKCECQFLLNKNSFTDHTSWQQMCFYFPFSSFFEYPSKDTSQFLSRSKKNLIEKFPLRNANTCRLFLLSPTPQKHFIFSSFNCRSVALHYWTVSSHFLLWQCSADPRDKGTISTFFEYKKRQLVSRIATISLLIST